MNQKKINKILIGILIVLVAFIGYSRLTEQKRVEYYICYDFLDSNMSLEPNEIKERCKAREE